MSRHTPGPWKIIEREAGRRIEVRAKDDTDVALIKLQPSGRDRTHLNNARLIAAAPDLLDACKLALSSCDPHAHFYKVIAAAIARAEGNEDQSTLGEYLCDKD